MNELPLPIEKLNTKESQGFKVINGGLDKKGNPVSNKNIKCIHKIKGKSSEVYAFRTKEEIGAMMDVFNNHIVNAPDKNKEKIAERNKLLFLVGINVGIRASDLRRLKWSFFYDEDMTFKKMYQIFPKKTVSKSVKLFFNNTVKTAMENYVSKYPIIKPESYIFTSRKGSDSICESSICRIIKDAAAEAGIDQNIGSHSLRKTWGFWAWRAAEDKNKRLIELMECFNHSSPRITLKYIGLMDDDIEKVYNSVNLGMEFI